MSAIDNKTLDALCAQYVRISLVVKAYTGKVKDAASAEKLARDAGLSASDNPFRVSTNLFKGADEDLKKYAQAATALRNKLNARTAAWSPLAGEDRTNIKGPRLLPKADMIPVLQECASLVKECRAHGENFIANLESNIQTGLDNLKKGQSLSAEQEAALRESYPTVASLHKRFKVDVHVEPLPRPSAMGEHLEGPENVLTRVVASVYANTAKSFDNVLQDGLEDLDDKLGHACERLKMLYQWLGAGEGRRPPTFVSIVENIDAACRRVDMGNFLQEERWRTITHKARVAMTKEAFEDMMTATDKAARTSSQADLSVARDLLQPMVNRVHATKQLVAAELKARGGSDGS